METKLKEIFSRILELPIEEITDNMEYNNIKNWDSIFLLLMIIALT